MAVYLQTGRTARVFWVAPDVELYSRATELGVSASLHLPAGKLAGTLSPFAVGGSGDGLPSIDFTAGATPDVITTTEPLTVYGTAGAPASYYARDVAGSAVGVRAVERLSAFSYRLQEPLDMASGELFAACFGVEVPASLLDFTGTHARIEWVLTDIGTGEERSYQQTVHVGRTLFAPAMSTQRAREYAIAAFPHATANRPDTWFELAAKRATERVERRVLASGRFPNLFGDAELFADAGLVSLRIELAFEGLVPAGFDPSGYQAQQEDELTRQLEYATAQQWHDANADGIPQADEFSSLFSLPLRLS